MRVQVDSPKTPRGRLGARRPPLVQSRCSPRRGCGVWSGVSGVPERLFLGSGSSSPCSWIKFAARLRARLATKHPQACAACSSCTACPPRATHVLLQPLNLPQPVVREIQLLEVDEPLQPLELGYAVALNTEDLELGEGVEALELADLVLPEPQLRKVDQLLEVLHDLGVSSDSINFKRLQQGRRWWLNSLSARSPPQHPA